MAPKGLRLLTALLLFVPVAPSAWAQAVEGDVVDETGAALASVAFGLMDEDGRLVAHGRSDATGHFRVQAPSPGRYRVHAAALGYRSLTGGPYDLVGDVALELFVVMHRVPIQLGGLDVEVEADERIPRLVLNGFYDRAAEGWGRFFVGDEIRRSGSLLIVEFLARLPSMQADVRGANVFGEESVRNPALYFDRGGARCVPALWVDGSLVSTGGSAAPPMRPDDWVGAGEVAGLEFYRGAASVPIQFSHSAACAVLVVWTRGS